MNGTTPPACLICGSIHLVVPAGFTQLYPQEGRMEQPVHWWECGNCDGCFAYPIPSEEAIRSNWGTVVYSDPAHEQSVATEKQGMSQRILSELARCGQIGKLLDVGCNTGMFLIAAEALGWKASGFDPNVALVEIARKRDLNVRQAWHAAECGYGSEEFSAIVASDVFYYSWNPFRDLHVYASLLCQGGVLAMRVSNKRMILGLSRRTTQVGTKRDRRISRLLQGQFHSVSISSLLTILRSVGFRHVWYDRHGSTTIWSRRTARTQACYTIADLISLMTAGRFLLHPGVLVYALK